MPKEKKQTFLGGVAVLTVAVALVKVIGAIYKIPLGNILGTEGMTHFNAAYKIYGFLLALSTAGLPMALSKLVAQSQALGRHNQARRLLRVALMLFAALGAVGTSLMLFWTEGLAALMHNSLAYWPIKALSLSVICVCIMSAFRGYFQGNQNMTPTAISQILEAVFKLTVGLALAWYCVSLGNGVELGAAAAILGVTIGSVLALLYMLISYFRHRRRLPRGEDTPQPYGVLLQRLLAIGIPITIGSSGMNLIMLIDQSLIMGRLQSVLGLTEQAAAALNGEYDFGSTLFNLPSSFIPPVTMCLIPFISAAVTRRDHTRVTKLVNTALRLTTLVAFPAGVGLSVLAGPILLLLYPKQQESAIAATYHLQILGFASIFVCLMLLTNAILQAHDRAYVPIVTMLVGGVVKVITNYVLVGNPSINIKGAPIGTLVCYGLIALLNVIAMNRALVKRPSYMQLFLKPALATAAMAVTAKGSFLFLVGRMSRNLSTLLAIGAAAAVYVVMVLLLRVITKEDLEMVPHGEKMAKFLGIR